MVVIGIVVRFTATYPISVYHHKRCEFESLSWRGVIDTTLCVMFVSDLCQVGWFFFSGTPVSSTNKTDHQDIAELLLKVALNTIIPNPLFLYITEDRIINVEHCYPVIRTIIGFSVKFLLMYKQNY